MSNRCFFLSLILLLVQPISDENPEQFFQPTSATAILDILKVTND